MFYEEFILKRYPKNPIIKPADFPGAEAIYNPGQTMYDGKTILLVAISHRSGGYLGKRGETTHVAESTDGVHFKIDPEPFLQIPDEEPYKSVDHDHTRSNAILQRSSLCSRCTSSGFERSRKDFG